ncbi:MAG: methyltransferase domain-containing protein [bacterium]|nr:methyltransferase domain-containing protein [bacterium]
MPDVWQLFGDDPEERERFASLATTLAHESSPAGPKNRLRSVARISVGGRTWFLKTFTRTQWKNRLRFLVTAPRASDDAGRELAVTQALRAAGIPAPRPVAYGRRGAEAFYLCAELPGDPLANWLAQPGRDPDLARAAARFCGDLLRRGFLLPDLAPDHIFVTPGASGSPRFAVLDLHNGRVAAGNPGPVDHRLLRRVLRRFARAARSTPAASPRALRFAIELIRAAGHRDARSVLAPLPPLWTATRYEATGKSAAYSGRNPRRAEREGRLLARVWPGQASETVLDLPCGAARLLPWLRTRGHEVLLGDGAFAMLQQARRDRTEDVPPPAMQADALALPLHDRAVAGVVQFRFLHHLPNEAARRAIAEACRVADRFVVVSFFHPCSFHHLQRRVSALLGRPQTRFARTLGNVTREFERHGFRRHAVAADRPYARDLWLASYVRA